MKTERSMVAEWWEVWLERPGEQPTLVYSPKAYPSADGRRPRHVFPNLATAQEFVRERKNRFLKIRHIRRFAKPSKFFVN